MTSEKRRKINSDLGFHPAERVSVHLSRYPDHPPILSAWTDTIHLGISTGMDEVDADHLAFARDLAEAVQGYLAECERLHAENNQTDNQTENDLADSPGTCGSAVA